MEKRNALSLVTEITLSYMTKVPARDRPKVTGPQDAFEIFYRAWDPAKIELQEAFKLLLLNRGNRVLGLVHLSTGGMAGAITDPKLVFAAALKAAAPGVILAHNHPSGTLRPSQADINITRKLKRGGKLLDIEVLDHLIITPHDGYYSFTDEGVT